MVLLALPKFYPLASKQLQLDFIQDETQHRNQHSRSLRSSTSLSKQRLHRRLRILGRDICSCSGQEYSASFPSHGSLTAHVFVSHRRDFGIHSSGYGGGGLRHFTKNMLGQSRLREKIIQGFEWCQKGKPALAQKVPPIHD